MIQLKENQLQAIKKGYADILVSNLKEATKESAIHEYSIFLKGYATALEVDFDHLDDALDSSMRSLHFIKQQIRFHSDKELFEFATNEIKYLSL